MKEPKVEMFFYIMKQKQDKNILEMKIRQFFFISSTGSQLLRTVQYMHSGI
jgi:hypothetical protein